jgi:hypothetical protein
MLDTETIKLIRENIVLAKLSDNIVFKRYENVDYIFFDKIVLPYNLFCLYIYSCCLWYKSLKQRQQQDLLNQINALWSLVGINELTELFELRKFLVRVVVDPNLVKFFAAKDGFADEQSRAFLEALFYYADQEYAKYCKEEDKKHD